MEETKKTRVSFSVVGLYNLWISIAILVIVLVSVSQSSSIADSDSDSSSTTSTVTGSSQGRNRSNTGNVNVTKIFKREYSFDNVVEELTEGKLPTKLVVPFWEARGNFSLANDLPIRLFSSGSLWNSQPVTMRNWEFQLQFQVHTEPENETAKEHGNEDYDYERGHGLVFWYTLDKNPQGLFAASSRPLDGLVILVQVYRDKHKIRHSTMSVMLNNRSRGHYEEFDWQVDGCWGHNLRGSDSSADFPSWLKITYVNNCLTVSTKLPIHSKKEGENKEIWSTCFKGIGDISLPQNYHFGLTPFPIRKLSLVHTEPPKNYLDIYQIRTFELDVPAQAKSACFNEVKMEAVGRRQMEQELVVKFLVLFTGFLILVGFFFAAIYRAYNLPQYTQNLPEDFY